VLWDIGHTVSLVIVGVILVIVGATLPEARQWIAISTGVLSVAVGILWSVPLL
jgi:cytochrome c biogenesis protein CcdA